VRWLLIQAVRFYQVVLGPLLPKVCRFEPSCSQYAIQALERYGAVGGSLLTLWRLARCAPWGGHGYDPVPERFGIFGRGRAT
jgi:putative membrane protein insertion efficiency factor